MPMFQIHRMKEAPRQQFRWAPHVAGAATVRARDYEPGGQIEADSEYDAYARLRNEGRPMAVGDVLETETGALCICKYVGFESASWFVPEAKSGHEAPPEPPEQAVQL